jgi:hypothetical protein
VPPIPAPEDLNATQRRAQEHLRTLVERAGGRYGTAESIPVDHIEPFADLFDAWGRRYAASREGVSHFTGRPGFWRALDELYPLQDPNRWDRLRQAVIEELEHRGWVRTAPPRGPGFDLPAG